MQACKGLFRSQSMKCDELPRYKRPQPCTEESPIQSKRRCSFLGGDESPIVIGSTSTGTIKPSIQRCSSEFEIKSSLNRNDEEPNLIGDRSRNYILPTIDGLHRDLKSISTETVIINLILRLSHIILSI